MSATQVSDTWATGLSAKQIQQAREYRCPDCQSTPGGWSCVRVATQQVVDLVHKSRWQKATMKT